MVVEEENKAHEKFKTILGEDFGSLYYHACAEWVDLSLTWKAFENLFGHSPEQVELLNRSGAAFFHRVDRLFFEAVALAVCRLSDPTESVIMFEKVKQKKPNLTVKRFELFMETEAQKTCMAELLNNVSTATEFARDWRNRHISHNDYGLRLGEAVPLKEATRNGMNAAIDALYRTLAYVSTEFLKTHLDNKVIPDLSSEMDMLDRLYLGDLAFERELDEPLSDRPDKSPRPNWLCS